MVVHQIFTIENEGFEEATCKMLQMIGLPDGWPRTYQNSQRQQEMEYLVQKILFEAYDGDEQ